MDDGKVKVSVIIPIYNVEKYLRECLDSVVNQTLRDIEIICVNDGSPDNCGAILDEYAQRDSRIKVINKENGGYGHTCNMGLEYATGEYVAIVEPDDYIDKRMYEELYDIAIQNNSDVVKSSYYDNLQSVEKTVIEKIEWVDFIPEDRSFTIYEYPHFLYYHPSIWSCIYKREFLNRHNIRIVEAPGAGWTDNPFQVQTMCLAERINYTPKAYYYWRRLNLCDSDDLKDYRIPFKRSDEIHQWLEENNITDEKTLLQLYRRELGYIRIVLGMKKISDFKDCRRLIRRMFSRFPDGFLKEKTIRRDEKRLYKSIRNSIRFTRLNIFIQRTRKKIISIRWNEREKFVRLFGKVLIGEANA